MGSISPGAVSRKRKNRWPSMEAALEHFRHKKAFARWAPQVLADYVAHGTHDEDGQRVLSFDRDIETAIYNTLPDNMDALFKRHPCAARWPSSAACSPRRSARWAWR